MFQEDVEFAYTNNKASRIQTNGFKKINKKKLMYHALQAHIAHRVMVIAWAFLCSTLLVYQFFFE